MIHLFHYTTCIFDHNTDVAQVCYFNIKGHIALSYLKLELKLLLVVRSASDINLFFVFCLRED